MLFCKGRVSLQHSTLPQEVKKVTIGSVFNGYVQVTWRRQRNSGCSFTDLLYLGHCVFLDIHKLIQLFFICLVIY